MPECESDERTIDYFIIHSRSLSGLATSRCEILESQGFKCYLPCRDVDEGLLPLARDRQILNAIRQSKNAILIWDGMSYGAIKDLGACQALDIPIEAVYRIGDSGSIHALLTEMASQSKIFEWRTM